MVRCKSPLSKRADFYVMFLLKKELLCGKVFYVDDYEFGR